MMPDGQGVNYISLLTRASSLMIRQNSKLMVELMKPDILLDIQMSRYSGTDYDKSEQIINAGKKTTKKTLDNLLFTSVTSL